jgi:hypothetical protein
MGSGTYLKRAIEKYGEQNFSKEILFIFSTPEEMYQKEAELVNIDYLMNENTYNLKVGGFGGFDYINSNTELVIKRNRKITCTKDYRDKKSFYIKRLYETGQLPKNFGGDHPMKNGKYMFEIKHIQDKAVAAAKTPEAISKKKAKLASLSFQQGKKNSQYNTMWITDGLNNRKIFKTNPIPENWSKGRVCKSSGA